ncbi:hemagglutinin repeat-containing protein [Rhizobium sp. BK491]|uniref:hemagglutinin repeat-containing protein n=1 Tax=Rhizobium sp. BK491 TaxID=2587009 RepID=UPI00160FD79A|nr:hemagglutinin repeat-containing protein [Rhizobium sp. BK491]MBB3571831.1 filamentous hemagglutinin [Rhizobium sp. BK491]
MAISKKHAGNTSSGRRIEAAASLTRTHLLLTIARQFTATVLSALLVFQPMLANAQSVSAAGSAPAAKQPGVGAAPNGVPLIDIVTPNSSGLSHNQYDNFNVGTQGLILNNFNSEVGTSNLGGATPGNPNLRNSGPASVILNEVISGNRSALNGPTEVFGGRADVIIANPNGITCAGCGFINTPRATLTTGVPNIGVDGSLTGFTVNGGDVTFEGAGGNFAAAPGAVDLFDVVARNIHVNAPIYGKTVRLTGGAGQYNYATGEATALTATSGTPEYAIDGTALGAMQADRIKVVVTEKGAGVKMSGDMAANAGELTLSADGKISIGNASARDGVTITSKQKVTAAKVTSKQKVTVQADQGITLQSVAADGDIALSSGTGLLSVAGSTTSLGDIQMASGAGIQINQLDAGGHTTLASTAGDVSVTGSARTGGDLTIQATAGSISAGSLLSYGNLALNAGLDVAIAGTVLAQGNLSASGRSISTGMAVSGINVAATSADPNGNVVLGSAGNLNLTATGGTITTGNLLSAGSLVATATGSMTAGSMQSANNLTVTAASLDASGVTSHGAVTVDTAGGRTDVSGQVLAASNVLISGGAITAGAIVSGVDFAATAANGGSLALGSSGDMTLLATGGLSATTLLSAGTITASAADLSAGSVTGHGAIALAGSNSLSVSGQILGANNVSLAGRTVSTGQIVTGVDFAATSQSTNGAIVIGSSGDLTITATGAAIGPLLVAGNLGVTAGSLAASDITDHGNVSVSSSGVTDTTTTGGRVDITGQLLAAGNVAVSGSSVTANTIVSGVDFAATSQSADGSVALGGGGDVSLVATAGDLNASNLLSAGSILASASGNIGNITPVNAVAHQNLTMTAGGTIALAGQSMSAGNVSLQGQSISAGSLVSGVDFAATRASTNGALMLAQGNAQSGTMTLTATNGDITASNALLSGGNLSAAASGDISYALLQSLANASLTAPGTISYTNATNVTGNLTIDAGTSGMVDLSGARGGNISAGGMLTVDAASANLSSSNLVLGGLALNLTGQADLTGATVSAVTSSRTASGTSGAGGNGDITIAAGSLVTTSATNLLAARDLTLTLPTLSNSGQLAAGSDLTINVSGDLTNNTTGLIYAGSNANLLVAGTLTNDQGAILAGNNLTIAGATPAERNTAVVNTAGLIQSGGDMSILTTSLVNGPLSSPAITRNVLISDTILTAYDQIYETYKCQVHCDTTGAGDHSPEYGWTQTIDNLVHQIVEEDQLTGAAGAGSKIRAGGNLTIDATNLTNSYSSIAADGDMALNVTGTLTNEGATLNRTTLTICDSANPCQYYPDVISSDPTTGGLNCSGPNRPCIGTPNTTLTYSANPNGTRDPSKDLPAGTTASIETIGVMSGVIQAGGALSIRGGGTVNNTASPGSIAGSVTVAPSTTPGNPLSALSGLTAGGALFSVNAAIGNVAGNGSLTASLANLTQISPANIARLAALAKPQSGGVGGTIPGQGFIFETRAAFLDVSKFYGSSYFLNRIGYKPETSVPFLGDAYFDNQLIDTQLRQLVGDGLGKGSFIPGDDAIEQMKTLLDNGVAYAEAHGLALGQALTPEQAASLTQSMVIYQTETVDGVQVLAPVVYLSAADRAKAGSSAAKIAGGSVDMTVGNLNNSGAIAAAGGLTLAASSIKASGGTFYAGGNLNLNAENGITLTAQTLTIGGQTIVPTGAQSGANAGGNLLLAGGDGGLTIAGTKVAAGGNASLSGDTVTLAAASQTNGGKNSLVGSSVTTGGDLGISGTNGVNIIASSASSGGDMAVVSTNGAVNIVSAGVDNRSVAKDRNGTTTRTSSQTQQGSSLTSGGSMLVSGDQGVLIAGSSLTAAGNVGLLSTNGNIAITASQDQTSNQSKTVASSANGYKSASTSSTSITNTGSSITSTGGSVTVEADTGNISVIGSDVAAKGGAANLIAKGDITIGEATDTASSSSKSGSKKATETTTTAQGSSVSGQTGVNIASTGGDVTISASDVTAGDATHPADANVTAAGNVVIASGKNTDETTSDSKKSGFLSSSKTHTHTYDENTVGSSISASGNVNVNANGETVVSGSEMAAGNDLSLSGSTVTVMGAEESHESDKQTKKSGIGVGSGGGFISIYGSKDSKSSQSSTDNIGSTLSSGGTTTITSTQGDVNIFGSSSHSGDGTVISSARDVNIAPGAEEQSSSSQTKRSGFGINFSSGDGSLSIGIGVAKSEEQRSKDANINAVSTLDSDGSITIAANRNINDQSGKILAAGPISLIAGDNVNMLSSNDVTNASEMQKKSFAGVSLTVQSSLISAGQQAMQAGSLLSGDNGIYGIAPAVLAGVNGYNAITSTMAAIKAEPDPKTGLKPAVAGISLTAGYSFSESSQQSTTSIPVPPEIHGSSVTIIAQSGDVVGRGVQITAGMGKDGQTPASSSDPDNGNVLISAAGNVDLESVQATSDSTSSSKAGSASIGIGASIDANGSVFNAGPTANAAYSSGKQVASSVTQVNSNVSGANTVTVVAGNTLTLAGGVLSGTTVNADAAKGIVIESRQDTASYDEKSQSAQLGISSGGISGGYNQGAVTGDYANVTQQSGIFAGSGGYHVSTDGTVNLVGGFIGSTADPKNNDLTANQILYSNIENSMSASSTSYGFSLLGSGIPVPVVGQPAKQSDNGATLATITPGNWTLTNQSQDLASLNTDASKANTQVDPFDIDKLKAQQQSAAALSQLANMAIGSLANKMQWDEGSPEKIALHAAAAAVVAQLAGGNAGQAAAAAGAEELANGILQQVLAANPNLTAAQKTAVGEWAAAFVGAAIGGNSGAAASLDNFNYNYLTHQNIDDKVRSIKETCAENGANSDACINAMAKLQEDLVLLSATQNDELNACRDAACVEKIREDILASKAFFDQDFKDLSAIDGQAAEIFLASKNSTYYALEYADAIGGYCQNHPGDYCAAIGISVLFAGQAVSIAEYGALGGVGATVEGITAKNSSPLAGAGGNWPRISETIDTTLSQTGPTGCGAACGSILLSERGLLVSQTELGGNSLQFAEGLARQLNSVDNGWKGISADMDDLGTLKGLNSTGSWAAVLKDPGPQALSHFVVVSGEDASGNLIIHDPWPADEKSFGTAPGTTYSMTVSDFQKAWTGYSVYKAK